MLQSIAINLHSMTDLITNSSTTIFTYSDGSLDVCKDMINEFFKTCGVDKTADEVFNFVVLCDYYAYTEFDKDEDEEIQEERDKLTQEQYDRIKAGLEAKPKWFTSIEETENSDGYYPENKLYITPIDQKFAPLADLIYKFLYSTNCEAVYQ